MEDKNPIAASIDWLVEQGFDRKQATNICKAIKADSPEALGGRASLDRMVWQG